MEATKQCTKCCEVEKLTDFHKHSITKDKLRPDCIQCYKYYQKSYAQSHKAEAADYHRLRRQVDAQFRLLCTFRTRLNQCIKNKRQTTEDLIGIPFEIFMDWIELQLPAEYSLNDLGKELDIDHVIPLSSFNLTDENQLKQAMSLVNLQPLEASKNMSKSNSSNPWLAVCQEAKAKYFIRQLNNKNLH